MVSDFVERVVGLWMVYVQASLFVTAQRLYNYHYKAMLRVGRKGAGAHIAIITIIDVVQSTRHQMVGPEPSFERITNE